MKETKQSSRYLDGVIDWPFENDLIKIYNYATNNITWTQRNQF